MLIGPLLFSFIYSYSIDTHVHAWTMPGLAWFLAAALMALTLLLAVNVEDVRMKTGEHAAAASPQAG